MQNDVRTFGRTARCKMNRAERDIASEKIAEKVIRAPWFQRAEYIACYLPTPDEVNTWTIIARAWHMKKRIFVPVIEKKHQMHFREIASETELQTNQFGILEPKHGDFVTARTLDVVLTPVVAFDESNHRVGMGGGYYDRTFSFLKDRKFLFHPRLIGLAFACQKADEISPNPWDIRLFSTITE